MEPWTTLEQPRGNDPRLDRNDVFHREEKSIRAGRIEYSAADFSDQGSRCAGALLGNLRLPVHDARNCSSKYEIASKGRLIITVIHSRGGRNRNGKLGSTRGESWRRECEKGQSSRKLEDPNAPLLVSARLSPDAHNSSVEFNRDGNCFLLTVMKALRRPLNPL